MLICRPGECNTLMKIDLRQLAENVGRAAAAERVILFGSQARGQSREDSDVDLALIVPDKVNRREALSAALLATAERQFPLDLVVLSHSTWEAGDSLLARQVRSEGVLLYGPTN